jgi:hypothetical protein
LARDRGLDRGCRDLLADSGVVEPALEAGAYVRVFSCHDCNSLNLCRAGAKSSAVIDYPSRNDIPRSNTLFCLDI